MSPSQPPLVSLSSSWHLPFLAMGERWSQQSEEKPCSARAAAQAVPRLLGKSLESPQPEKGIEAESVVSWGSAETTSSCSKQKAAIYVPFLPPLIVLSNESVRGGCALGDQDLLTRGDPCRDHSHAPYPQQRSEGEQWQGLGSAPGGYRALWVRG